MMCRACGMDSRTNDRCEWCKKPMGGAQVPLTGSPAPFNAAPPAQQRMPLTAPPPQPLTAPQPPMQSPMGQPPPLPPMPLSNANASYPSGATGGIPTLPAPAPTQRMSLTGEVYDAPPPPMPAPGGAMPGGMPLLPSSAPGSGMPLNLPPGAIAPSMAEGWADDTPLGERWEKFLALALPALLIAVCMVHYLRGTLPVITPFIVFAFIGLALGASRAIPTYDDAFSDCLAVLAACYFCGPVVGLVVIVVLGLGTQNPNPALIALLATHLVARAAFMAVWPFSTTWLSIKPHLIVGPTLDFFAVCMAFGGWILSSFFRPVGD